LVSLVQKMVLSETKG